MLNSLLSPPVKRDPEPAQKNAMAKSFLFLCESLGKDLKWRLFGVGAGAVKTGQVFEDLKNESSCFCQGTFPPRPCYWCSKWRKRSETFFVLFCVCVALSV